jgi:hypothetical protein
MEKVYHICSVFLFSLQLVFETLFTLINIYQVTHQLHTEKYVVLHVKRPLCSLDYNSNFNLIEYFNTTGQS